MPQGCSVRAGLPRGRAVVPAPPVRRAARGAGSRSPARLRSGLRGGASGRRKGRQAGAAQAGLAGAGRSRAQAGLGCGSLRETPKLRPALSVPPRPPQGVGLGCRGHSAVPGVQVAPGCLGVTLGLGSARSLLLPDGEAQGS